MRGRAIRIAALLGLLAVVLGGVSLVNGASEARPPAPVSASTSAQTLVARADAALQTVRETGDYSYYLQAQDALDRAARLSPRDAGVQVGLGTLALARHQFRAGLTHGRAAHAAEPKSVRPYAVLVDAEVELGRYQSAGRTLQRMIDLKPNLASYARVSYFRELHGDLDGAVQAMRLAVSAGAGPENVAYVQTLLGQLQFQRGRLARAGDAFALALRIFPDYLPAQIGRARLDASRGRFGAAITRARAVVDRYPLPDYVVTLGELELAAGRPAAARRDLALVDAERRLLAADGINADAELALFEADYGDAQRGVALGRRAWRDAPSVRSADALAWALTRAGRAQDALRYARRAVRLGSRDALLLTHAGLTARAAGRPALARRHLTRALAGNPSFSPLWAPRARRALKALS